MGIYKIKHKIDKDKLINKIVEIFDIEVSTIKYEDWGKGCFDINFCYKDMLVHIYTNIERLYKKYYQDIEIKKVSTEYEVNWTEFWMLYAYYDNHNTDMRVNYDNMVLYLIKLKSYIDEGKVFFEYHNKDYSKRYFVLDGKVKELPILMNLDTENELRFGEDGDRVERFRKSAIF